MTIGHERKYARSIWNVARTATFEAPRCWLATTLTKAPQPLWLRPGAPSVTTICDAESLQA
jgi:hypothetical protein